MPEPLERLRRRLARFLLRDSKYIGRLKRVEQQQLKNSRALSGLQFLLAAAPAQASSLMPELQKSQSQYWQDIFVLSELGPKRDGYFVEFGAADGLSSSNTYMLESEYGWRGIVAEPARHWHAALQANRKCHIEFKCVWSESGCDLSFTEAAQPVLSTLSAFSKSDFHASSRVNGRQYQVETISLLDLLKKHDAPGTIDYLSIDTEGSEFEILSRFDFDRYSFRIITCEHNNTPMRQKLFELLTSKGYERRLEAVSMCDDWYVNAAVRQPRD